MRAVLLNSMDSKQAAKNSILSQLSNSAVTPQNMQSYLLKQKCSLNEKEKGILTQIGNATGKDLLSEQYQFIHKFLVLNQLEVMKFSAATYYFNENIDHQALLVRQPNFTTTFSLTRLIYYLYTHASSAAYYPMVLYFLTDLATLEYYRDEETIEEFILTLNRDPKQMTMQYHLMDSFNFQAFVYAQSSQWKERTFEEIRMYNPTLLSLSDIYLKK